MTRLNDLRHFYHLLDVLEQREGGKRVLHECTGRLPWPPRGVYFFFEPGELRTDSGTGPRVVRVGTHAVSTGSKATLWKRLSQHRGTTSGRGNHRGSIFRLLTGEALMASGSVPFAPTWCHSERDPAGEDPVERAVSRYLGSMSLLCLSVPDPPSRESLRAQIERNVRLLLRDKTPAQWVSGHQARGCRSLPSSGPCGPSSQVSELLVSDLARVGRRLKEAQGSSSNCS